MSDQTGELNEWIAQQLSCRPDHVRLALVAGDASPRRYYRVTLSQGVMSIQVTGQHHAPLSCIAMVSPASENNEAFLHVGATLRHVGLRSPLVWAHALQKGWFLLEDFGDQQLLPMLLSEPESASSFYRAAFSMLLRQVCLTSEGAGIPHYDAQRLRSELTVFPEWFLSGLLNIDLDSSSRRRFSDLSDFLVSSAAAQPTVWVHRDFHSRNLMVLDGDELGVIDFQDAVLGPITYDPVSLLKDCYIRWPRNQQLQWLDKYLERLKAQGKETGFEALSARVPNEVLSQANASVQAQSSVKRQHRGREITTSHAAELAAKHGQRIAQELEHVSAETFRQWFDLIGLQRHLRVLGVFARLHLRDHKSGYLADLPLVVEYVREALTLAEDADESLGNFGQWFESDVMPVVREQPWYPPADPEGLVT